MLICYGPSTKSRPFAKPNPVQGSLKPTRISATLGYAGFEMLGFDI